MEKHKEKQMTVHVVSRDTRNSRCFFCFHLEESHCGTIRPNAVLCAVGHANFALKNIFQTFQIRLYASKYLQFVYLLSKQTNSLKRKTAAPASTTSE